MKTSKSAQLTPRQFALGALALLGLLLAGCVTTSIYPFYTEKDVVFDPKLVGRWSGKPEDTNEFWSFERDRTNAAYLLRIVEGQKDNKYWVHLFKLKQWTFIDAQVMADCEGMVSPHYLAKVVRMEPTLELQLMNHKWLEAYLEEHPRALRHIRKPGEYSSDLVLTADTAELQKFLLKHANDTNLFTENLTPMVRTK